MAVGDAAAPPAGTPAQRQRERADEHARLGAVARQMAESFSSEPRNERRLASTLIELEPLGYTVLADRRRPGAHRPNLDLILVGPGGVVLIDTRILCSGDEPGDDEVAEFADLVFRIQSELADIGLAPGQVTGMAVALGRERSATRIYGIQLLGEAEAVQAIARRPRRLDANQVARVRTELERAFPPMTTGPITIVGDAAPRAVDEAAQLLDRSELTASLRAGAVDGAAETWMSFLHPDQARIVRRSFAGPMRIRGAAGTGKTVVALHRAAHLARTVEGRILFTSYVRTLPKVMSAVMQRLAPDVADRIEFRGVHGFARSLLSERGLPVAIDDARAAAVFTELWEQEAPDGILARLDPRPRYWHEELRRVIKGRGLTRFEEYERLSRTGRRRPMDRDQRAAMWRLFERYEATLAERGIRDSDDLILDAEASLRAQPLAGFDVVIVDEAQDLSCAMLRMLHLLVGDRPDGLHLVSDGRQTVYPGGYTLAEAGVSVAGRGAMLRTNYRNTAEIADVAATLADTVPDIEGVTDEVAADVIRVGARPVFTIFPSRAVHDRSLVERVKRLVEADGVAGWGEIGVLALRTWHAREAADALEAAGIPTI
ncbi:MAG TPA: UvrD-helicase domain-containing protein, partial [Pseudolysinimonas sp.]|nr:UvrD-helicase domain-containing protein [Pseudolysinimonas sp.]